MRYSCSLVFLLIFCTACNLPIGSSTGGYPLEKNIRIANNQRLKKQGLYEVGWGGGGYPEIHTICESYITISYRFKSIDDARLFFFRHLEELVKSYNDEPEIRPYLYNFPFKPNNIELEIYFYNQWENDFLQQPYITGVTHREGVVSYISLDKPHTDKVFWLPHRPVIHQESIEEGYAIYKKQVGR